MIVLARVDRLGFSLTHRPSVVRAGKPVRERRITFSRMFLNAYSGVWITTKSPRLNLFASIAIGIVNAALRATTTCFRASRAMSCLQVYRKTENPGRAGRPGLLT
jgi:hypothetical protein